MPDAVRGLRRTLGALFLLLAGASEGMGQGGTDRELYIRFMAGEFSILEGEADRLLEERIAPDELPVVLFLSRESGIAAPAILASRRSGLPWVQVARRGGVFPDRLFVEIPSSLDDPRIRRIRQLFSSTPRTGWGSLELSDDEVITLVHLRVLTRGFGRRVDEVLTARALSASWIEVPRRLTR
jgi:hypothetical protein